LVWIAATSVVAASPEGISRSGPSRHRGCVSPEHQRRRGVARARAAAEPATPPLAWGVCPDPVGDSARPGRRRC